LIESFIRQHPYYIEKMRSCTYYSDKYLNLHHLEGDVWSHTLLSYSKGLQFKLSNTILFALLLHDIGRVYTRYINKDKETVHFGDFEGVSCFVALDILKDFHLSNNEKIDILKIIMNQYTIIDFVKYDEVSWHEFKKQFLYDENLLQNLFSYVKCDLFGRIIDSTKEHYYDLKKIQKYEIKSNSLQKRMKELQKRQKDVYILIGLPCSGKSTWRSEHLSDTHVVSRDLCIDIIGKKYKKETHDAAYLLQDKDENIAQEVDSLFEKMIEESYSTKKAIVIDNLSLSMKNRAGWIKKYHKTHNIHGVLFLKSYIDLIDCDQQRSQNENKTIGHDLLLKHMMRFRFPLLNEGFDTMEYVFC